MSDKTLAWGAVAHVVDLATGLPLALRELPELRKAQLEQGAGIVAQSAGAKGWDHRAGTRTRATFFFLFYLFSFHAAHYPYTSSRHFSCRERLQSVTHAAIGSIPLNTSHHEWVKHDTSRLVETSSLRDAERRDAPCARVDP